MPRRRQEIDIPGPLLDRYRWGELTVRQLARLVHSTEPNLTAKLHGLGLDTSVPASKRRRAACRYEAAGELAHGTAYRAAAELYRQGWSARDIADRLGQAHKTTLRLLYEMDVAVRPEWHREFFRHPDGRRRDLAPFAARLRQLRLDRGWTQAQLGKRCGLSQGTISHLEKGVKGPNWDTALKVADGLGVELEELGITWEPVHCTTSSAECADRRVLAEVPRSSVAGGAMDAPVTVDGVGGRSPGASSVAVRPDATAWPGSLENWTYDGAPRTPSQPDEPSLCLVSFALDTGSGPRQNAPRPDDVPRRQ